MKLERGQLVRFCYDNPWLNYGVCIVLEKTCDAVGDEAYSLWSINLQEKLRLAAQHISPINPQETQSEV